MLLLKKLKSRYEGLMHTDNRFWDAVQCNVIEIGQEDALPALLVSSPVILPGHN